MMKTNLRQWLLTIFMAFLISCGSDDANELLEPTILNECKTVGENVLIAVNANGNEVKALTIRVTAVDDSLLVEYLPEQGFYVNNLRYHISLSPNEIPQGETGFREYIFDRAGRKIVISKLTKQDDFSGLLYMSAFASLGTYKIDPIEQIQCKVTRANNLESKQYFIHTLNKVEVSATDTVTLEEIGEFPAFCLQGDQAMNTSSRHIVRRLSGYTGDKVRLDGIIDEEQNMDLLNWIINQDRTRWMRSDGLEANGADIQQAIWTLIESTGEPTGQYIEGLYDEDVVKKIVADAKLFGQGFIPGCEQNELVILHKGVIKGFNEETQNYNFGKYGEPNYQVSGIVQKIDCDNVQRVFSKGTKFRVGDSDELAQYFAICIN